MTFVILTGGIDLSVGSIVGFTGIIAGALINQGIEIAALGVVIYPHTWMVLVISLAFLLITGRERVDPPTTAARSENLGHQADD